MFAIRLYKKFYTYTMSLAIYFRTLLKMNSVNASTQDSTRLFEDLLNNYNQLVRPAKTPSEAVEIQFKFKLLQILDVVSDLILQIKKWSKISFGFAVVVGSGNTPPSVFGLLVLFLLTFRFRPLSNRFLSRSQFKSSSNPLPWKL